MKNMLVTITKTAEVEVNIENARQWLLGMQYEYGPGDIELMDDETVAEVYVSYVEGQELDLCFDRTIRAVTVLQEGT